MCLESLIYAVVVNFTLSVWMDMSEDKSAIIMTCSIFLFQLITHVTEMVAITPPIFVFHVYRQAVHHLTLPVF